MKQLFLGSEMEQLERISKLGDNLEKLNRLIDFEIFREVLEKKVRKEDYSKGGRPPFDVIMMFKILILQLLNCNVSDERTEFLIIDRLSWQRFLGLVLGEKVPDRNTIWLFKEKIGAETMCELLTIFNEMLYQKGYISNKGVITDATFNEVPKRRATTREENKSLKNGEIPDSLKKFEESDTHKLKDEEIAHNHKIAQIDTDATWAEKGDETHFGYKGHVAVDAESKIVTHVEVTTASVHDVKIFVDLVLKVAEFLKIDMLFRFLIFADSGYTGKEYTDFLQQKFPFSIIHIIKKAAKNRPLRGWEKSYNHSVAKVRCRVEHVFGSITNDMGGIFTRSIGIARNARDIAAKFLAYNIKRAAFLFGEKRKAV